MDAKSPGFRISSYKHGLRSKVSFGVRWAWEHLYEPVKLGLIIGVLIFVLTGLDKQQRTLDGIDKVQGQLKQDGEATRRYTQCLADYFARPQSERISTVIVIPSPEECQLKKQ